MQITKRTFTDLLRGIANFETRVLPLFGIRYFNDMWGSHHIKFLNIKQPLIISYILSIPSMNFLRATTNEHTEH